MSNFFNKSRQFDMPKFDFRFTWSTVISIAMCFITMAVAWGGLMDQNRVRSEDIMSLKVEIHEIAVIMGDLRVEVANLRGQLARPERKR